MPSRFPVAFRLPAFASRVILRPLGSSAFLTVGPPTTTNAASDPIGIATFRTYKMRPDWVPSRPRDGGAHPVGSLLLHRRLPLRSGQSSSIRYNNPSADLNDDEATSRVHSRSPARSFPHP